MRAALPVRRAEFTAGRHCARVALASLGVPSRVIGVGPAREPLWPARFTGSITHTSSYAAAVVGSGDEILALGIDVEPIGSLTPDLWEAVLTPTEIQRFRASPLGPALAAAIAFSAKECLHKALFPATGVMLDFHDAEVVPAPAGTWQARIASVPRGWLADSLHGRWQLCAGLLLCGLVVPCPVTLDDDGPARAFR